MFYSHSLLSRNGPLGTIWVAAHFIKKLKKEQIAHTDISSSVDKIVPEIQISYRVLAQLLLGIVRIFSKKVDYLYHDCNVALICIRKSFAPVKLTVTKGANTETRHHLIEAEHEPDHDISSSKEPVFAEPVETMRAPYHHITISVPERLALDSFDLDVPDDNDTAHTSPHEQFTLQDQCLDDINDLSYLNECNHRESVICDEINSSCFTPVNDVLPSHTMDINLEFDEECNFSCGNPEKENLQGDIRFHGWLEEKKSLDPIMPDGESEDRLHPVKMIKTTDSDIADAVRNLLKPADPLVSQEAFSLNYKNLSAYTNKSAIVTHPTKTHNEDLSSCDLGVPSPKFTVRTPAKREHHRMLKKRKNFFDETIVLSNESLRKGIHDASSLIFKRRKAPHTLLDAWKSYRIPNLQQNILEPVITCMASELKALFQSSSSFYSPIHSSANHHLESQNVDHQTCSKSTKVQHSYNNPDIEVSPPKSGTDVPRTDTFGEMEVNLSLGLSGTGLDIMGQDLESQEKGTIGQDNGWSPRTRAVAQFLCSQLLHPKGEQQKESLSLQQILLWSKRPDSARFFYEILILKGYQSIDVNQDSPYGDILISPTPKLEADLSR
ncbi:hypothetical protein OPV22_022880 [Ensete ventricosum]|uniref:Rad21/Rec8-like protein N-terminal domain-containing protein n=1 Tax=Ensete ventricosum TaxID=4639 RepID=A0AAV8QQT5_ENSVE|nr:hypothetical protein OPV22_022880 [Ensete ventricosum]